jgi:hypothetical protein
MAAGAVFFAWRTVRLALTTAREARSDRIARRIEQIALAVEAIYLSTTPSDPHGIAQDRLDYAMIGLSPELPKTWQITQMLGMNRAISAGVQVPGLKVSSDDDIRRQCVEGRTELELKLSLVFTQIGDIPDPEKWINRPNRREVRRANRESKILKG